MSFSARELAKKVKRHSPSFVCTYEPDERQKIADSWPKSTDDRCSRKDLGWKLRFNLRETLKDMLKNLRFVLGGSSQSNGISLRFPGSFHGGAAWPAADASTGALESVVESSFFPS